MSLLKCVLVFVLFVAVCESHLCLLSPPQRSALNNINQKGSDSCYGKDAPCGGVPAPSQVSSFYAKQSNLTVVFQKNLDHFSSGTPGRFALALATSPDGQFTEFASYPDMGEPSLNVYVVNVSLATLPFTFANHAVLQVAYFPNNPNAPPSFYQCADMAIL